MGLDGVELVMEIEERFNVSIADEDAQCIRTVGDLCDYLLKRARVTSDCVCPTATAFYRIRRAFKAEFNCRRVMLKPATAMEAILPRPTRRDDWERLAGRLDLILPPLRWPLIVQVTYFWFCLTLFILPIAAFLAVPHLATLTGAVLAAIVIFVPGSRYFRRLAVVFPASMTTVGGFAQALAVRLHMPSNRDVTELEPWIVAQVFDIVAEQTGVERATLHRDTRFVQDLGID